MDSVLRKLNELYQKKKSVGLTEEERTEEAKLREIYLKQIRNNFKAQLDNIEIQDKEDDKCDKKLN